MKNMLGNANVTLRFKPVELHHFNWIYKVAPCFPLNASKVNIISDPGKFYDTLCESFKNATRRISVASLYIGTGTLERSLLQITKKNIEKNKNLIFNVLLDHQRGTRGKVNSLSLLQEFVNDVPSQCRISLFQTPRLQASWSKALPSRYNELVGLQHMKLYIADDKVLLSGANCSNDYFQQRQDRYIQIEDEDLANFYCELIDEVSHFSKRSTKEGLLSVTNKESMIKDMNFKITELIERWKERQQIKLFTTNKNETEDTWIFPLIQMGEFKINQDEIVTKKFIASVPSDTYLRLATGYFNLTADYANALLKNCRANISLLMAHPNANGFMGAAGPAGGIPHAYSLIAKEFWQKVVESNQTNRVEMLEYERSQWTFHAKGLWYYPADSGVPWATVVGSANLGERSVRRDLEAQAAIFTRSHNLQSRLHDECSKLHEFASECSSELQERQTPLWVRATVGLFRTYF